LLPAVVLRNDAEALNAAHELAQAARLQAAKRDQQRKLPWAQIEQFTRSGLGSISIPREYGGPQVSFTTLADVFAIISAADPALGQIPQNHFGILHVLRAPPPNARKNSCSRACSTAGASATPARSAAPGTPWNSRPASPPRVTAT
jgi:alkylation response protein AidB-like acyl-CoA dehydrogenase